MATEYLIEKGSVTKIIKTSIIGYELNTNASLLQWFLTTEIDEMGGWSENYWNGITTLQWAKICYDMMLDWGSYNIVNIPGTECISKYDLVNIFKRIFFIIFYFCIFNFAIKGIINYISFCIKIYTAICASITFFYKYIINNQ